MTIASIVRGDNSGLGNLAREFWDNGIINKALIVPNGVYQVFPERYPGQRKTAINEINEGDVEWLLEKTDVLLFFETPYRWDIIAHAKKRGIKTFLMIMHEQLPDRPPFTPDVWLAPSDIEAEMGLETIRINVPVNTDRVKWKKRDKAKVFIHNAGHGGMKMRNGTAELLKAMQYVKSDIKLIINSQTYNFENKDERVEVRWKNYKNYWDIWKDGDVLIFPEKFNGLSLPIQEAVASGLMVMSTDRRPMNEWLPKEPLIPVKRYFKDRIFREVECAEIDPKAIAEKIDEFANQDISEYSEWGKRWAEENSWEKLKPKYLEILCG